MAVGTKKNPQTTCTSKSFRGKGGPKAAGSFDKNPRGK